MKGSVEISDQKGIKPNSIIENNETKKKNKFVSLHFVIFLWVDK